MSTKPAILVVDDEQVVRDSLSKWFREDGYAVGSAANAAEALRELQNQKWDIILLDIKMPGMDGMELQARIKEVDPSGTIIFITAHATVDTAVKALKAGAYDYVTKPVDPDYLSHLVSNALKQRSLANENAKLKEQMSEFSKADEIGNIDAKTQMDLLRAIETKQFTRVGGNENIKVDFRVICATNRDLEKAVAEGTFREDLYYRLNVFSIFIPPLRERKGDIPQLVNHFVEKYSRSMSKSVSGVTSEAMDILVRYNWPGNVRELENAIERAMVVGKPPKIQPDDLPFQLIEKNHIFPAGSLASAEKTHVAAILEQNRWNISRSAEVLQIDRVTLYNKIEKYGLKKPQ